MPGKPQNHRAEWSQQELEELRTEVKEFLHAGRSMKAACKALRYKFKRKPRALESMYYRLERAYAAPAAELLYAATGPVVSGGTVEAMLEALDEAGADLSDMSKVTIIKGKRVVLKSQTVHTVEEV